MTDLRIAGVDHRAAVHACTNWHYSRSVPVGKQVKVGAWEDGRFIGVVMFGRGATPNLGRPYRLTQTEVCELTRVALDTHTVPVTQIVAAALRHLKRTNPGIRLVVSFADPAEGHHGGIYQAGGWLYAGTTPSARYFKIKGRQVHPRRVGLAGGVQSLAWVQANMDPNAAYIDKPGKHRYLYPLDRAMRRQIEPLRRPAPRPHTDTRPA